MVLIVEHYWTKVESTYKLRACTFNYLMDRNPHAGLPVSTGLSVRL